MGEQELRDMVRDTLVPRQVVFDLSPEQRQAAKEESERWGMDAHETIQFILRWGWLKYFKE